MAKYYANKPDDIVLTKKLWMKIAKYLFNDQGEDDSNEELLEFESERVTYKIPEALEILKDSRARLRIDDLLPLFPADEKVKDMKQHLCDCLNDYHDERDSLRKELESNSTSAESLRK
jgi:hypothetical protein